MAKKKAVAKEPVELPMLAMNVYNGEKPIGLSFEQEYDKELIDWDYDKKGRKLELSLYGEVDSLEDYKYLHQMYFGKNFIKDRILINDDDEAINNLFVSIKQSKLLFDFIIIEATIAYEDPESNFMGEFSHYHGISLTVNGKKYLNDIVNGN